MILFFIFLLYGANAHDVYSEELTISRLPSNNVLSQFRFLIETDGEKLGPEFELFPRVLAEISQNHFAEELFFSLGQGRWFADKWGVPPQPSSPTGAHIYAWIKGNNTKVDTEWAKLVNALNGIFCTSLTNIVPILSASPAYSLRPKGKVSTTSQLRYGALAKESLCTENLTPWRALLPCKQNGIATLLTPIKLYSSLYHSMYFHLHKKCNNKTCGWSLELGLTLVSDLDLRHGKLDWELLGLMGRKVTGYCNAATSSVVKVLVDSKDQVLEPPPLEPITVGKYSSYNLNNTNTVPFFTVSSYYSNTVGINVISAPFPISISSTLGGSEQSSGVLVTKIINKANDLKVVLTHMIPWYVMLYYHTLDLSCLSGKHNKAPKIYNKRFVPAVSRQVPALIEFDFILPADSLCSVLIKFDKAFLRLREYPPDANHGLYIPGAVLTVKEKCEIENSCESEKNVQTDGSLVLHSNVLLVALPTPDFSMPFNVICFVLTAMTLCFGPLHSFSTQILIPVNTALPVSPKLKKLLRVFLLGLIVAAGYLQYHEISLNELRRKLVEYFEKALDGFKKMNNI